MIKLRCVIDHITYQNHENGYSVMRVKIKGYNDPVTIDFDGQYVKYEASELDEVVLAYATTIHKAQGSEYPIVVIPVLMTHFVMLQRNLIYTNKGKEDMCTYWSAKGPVICNKEPHGKQA